MGEIRDKVLGGIIKLLKPMIMKSIKKVIVLIPICRCSTSIGSLNIFRSLTDNIFVFDFNLWRITASSEDCGLKVRLLMFLLLRLVKIFSAEQRILFVILAELLDREWRVAKWAKLLLQVPLLNALRVEVMSSVAG